MCQIARLVGTSPADTKHHTIGGKISVMETSHQRIDFIYEGKHSFMISLRVGEVKYFLVPLCDSVQCDGWDHLYLVSQALGHALGQPAPRHAHGQQRRGWDGQEWARTVSGQDRLGSGHVWQGQIDGKTGWDRKGWGRERLGQGKAGSGPLTAAEAWKAQPVILTKLGSSFK